MKSLQRLFLVEWVKSDLLKRCLANLIATWKVLRQTLFKSVFGLLKILVMPPSLRLLANGLVVP